MSAENATAGKMKNGQTEYVALEVGRGGPGPKKPAVELCQEWNTKLKGVFVGGSVGDDRRSSSAPRSRVTARIIPVA